MEPLSDLVSASSRRELDRRALRSEVLPLRGNAHVRGDPSRHAPSLAPSSRPPQRPPSCPSSRRSRELSRAGGCRATNRADPRDAGAYRPHRTPPPDPALLICLDLCCAVVSLDPGTLS